MKKLITIIATLALVLALAAPAMAQGNPAADDPFVTVDPDTPPCPIGLDEAEAQTGQQLVCGEGGGYLPKGSSGSASASASPESSSSPSAAQYQYAAPQAQYAAPTASPAAELPPTGGSSLLALGAGVLLVAGGLLARRIVR